LGGQKYGQDFKVLVKDIWIFPVLHFKSCICIIFKKVARCWALVAHSCNPRTSGGWDQEDQSLKDQMGQIVFKILSWKTQHKNRADGVAEGIDPEFKHQYHKKKKKKKTQVW
jgi:hypothetical protein